MAFGHTIIGGHIQRLQSKTVKCKLLNDMAKGQKLKCAKRRKGYKLQKGKCARHSGPS